ncbi:hypothetical protein VSDG_01512 [Cytospora chrysosperma]|uniref:Uncharacterized protein n=1 Tax=Cytospora chrysosperma TaxID=252740 RepID=A0A423WJA0_CYTCH|nr:hypothetical protein VSDG_01512 [Valsa sordida]
MDTGRVPLVLMRLLLSLLDTDCGDLVQMPLAIVRAGSLSRGPRILVLLLVLALVRTAVWIEVLFAPMPARRHLVPLAAVDTGRGDYDEKDQEGDPQAEAELCREVGGVCGGFLVAGTGGGGSG